MEQEAFVYLWYDASNKKYYLGKHKGTPDDAYTHSSTIWESFTKDTIPEGVSRRILAYGTDEEMCILEHELLINRKKRCWDRYYNNSLGDPRYVNQYGKNNPSWKGGITYNWNEYSKGYMNGYRQTAKHKEYLLRNKEKIAARKKEYYLRNKEKHKAHMREYYLKKKAERQGESTLDRFM